MRIVLFEDQKWQHFLPLVYTRPVGNLLIGIENISTKWQRVFDAKCTHRSRVYLDKLFPETTEAIDLWINARLLPDEKIIDAIQKLSQGEMLLHGEDILAVKSDKYSSDIIENLSSKHYESSPLILGQITDLFSLNAIAIIEDYKRITASRISQKLHDSNILIGDPSKLFLEEGAIVYASTLNTNDGPIYIGRDAEVMEGSTIRGPFVLGEHSALKMSSKIYGATTIGPHCKIGGEVSNSLIQGYSNKAHDGFIGNSIIGQWCNLGADTNTSNLKNNYSPVRIFDYSANGFVDTGLTFCGLIMGDHSKCSINTMFNTGTVAGVGANIFGTGFPPKHVPSFSWGGTEGMMEYDLTKMMETAARVYGRRSLDFGQKEKDILSYIFSITAAHRATATQSQE